MIIDGHLDLAYNALFHRRDLTLEVNDIRRREDPVPWRPVTSRDSTAPSPHPDAWRAGDRSVGTAGICTVTYPALRRGGVGIVVSTIMARVQAWGDRVHNASRSQTVAWAKGRSHLAYYQAMERAGHIEIIHDRQALERHVGFWSARAPASQGIDPVGVILSMESADPIIAPDEVGFWNEVGLRSIALTHFGANSYGHGTGTRGGLYPRAYPLLDALADTGIAVDLTHAADLAFWQILDHWHGPVHASHCNCRALVPGQRQLSDEMIKAIVERGGVIGVVLHEGMLHPHMGTDHRGAFTPAAVRSLDALVDRVEHICELAGNANHVAIGSDLDGGYGRELAPVEIDSIEDLPMIGDALARRGFDQPQRQAIGHGNLVRFFGESWGGET